MTAPLESHDAVLDSRPEPAVVPALIARRPEPAVVPAQPKGAEQRLRPFGFIPPCQWRPGPCVPTFWFARRAGGGRGFRQPSACRETRLYC
jgi:hypothetical protein